MRFLRFLPFRRKSATERTATDLRAPGGVLWAAGTRAQCVKEGGWYDQLACRYPGPGHGEVCRVTGLVAGPEIFGSTIYLRLAGYRGAFSAAHFHRLSREIDGRETEARAADPAPPSNLKMEAVACLS